MYEDRKLKAFCMDDYTWYAHYSREEAIALFKEDCGYDDDDYDGEECYELSDKTLDAEVPEHDEDERPTGNMTSPRKWLDEMKNPGWLAGKD